jgi:hypothetical protein
VEEFLEALADENYAVAWQLWDTWTTETGQEDWISIISTNLSKPKHADLISACDSLLECKLDNDKKEDEKPKLDDSDDWNDIVVTEDEVVTNVNAGWEAVKAALTADMKDSGAVIPTEVAITEKKDQQLELPQPREKTIARDGHISKISRKPSSPGSHKYTTNIQVDFSDTLLPQTEEITVEEDITAVHTSSQWFVDKSVTVVRVPGKPSLIYAKSLWNNLRGSGGIKTERRATVVSGGAQAVGKVPFTILERGP